MTGGPPADGVPPVPAPRITVPNDAVVLLVGAAGAGKSTFAGRWFPPTAVLSSDAFRAMLADDATDQSVSAGAFALLHRVLEARLARGRLSVVDATNTSPPARRAILRRARGRGAPVIAIVLDLPLGVCLARNAARPGRAVPPAAVERQWHALRGSIDRLPEDGYAAVHVLSTAEAVDRAAVELVGVSRPR